MLPEDEKDRREIHQLLFVANAYLDLAEEEKKGVKSENINKKLKDLSCSEQCDEKAIMTLAHLASSAIRLCTIDDKLKDKYFKDENAKTKIDKFRKCLYNDYKKNPITSPDKIFRYILRNNIAHIEADRQENKNEQFIKCQNKLSESFVTDLHKKINNIRNAVTIDLKFFGLT